MKRYGMVFSLLLSLLSATWAFGAEINWNDIKGTQVKMFYPGVASWEFLNSSDHGVGKVPVNKRKKACPECHVAKGGELDLRAPEITNGSLKMKASKNPFEPAPVDKKVPIIDADLRVAYDDSNIYIRVQWDSAGKTWNGETGAPDRISIQVNAGQDEFHKYGCFVTCHPDENSMPDAAPKDKVFKNAYYSKLKRDDVRLYAFYTRTEDGGWVGMKDTKEIEGLSGSGRIDLWEATFKSKGMEGGDWWILEDRQEDKNDIDAKGSWENGKYTVTIKRGLKTGDAKDVELKEGSVFTIGMAVHDNDSRLRRHYVTFPINIGIGADAPVQAVKVK